MAAVKLTYYLEILSSWCSYVEPVWTSLQERYAGHVDFAWKIALMNRSDFPVSRAQCDWFYQRSGTLTCQPRMLNSGWFDAQLHGNYEAPNLVAEAGRDFGLTDDRLRRALTAAALRDGRKIGDMGTAVTFAARTFKLNGRKLRLAAESKPVRERVAADTAEFHAHQINQRPAFVLTDAIGDKVIFSGLVKTEPLTATIDAMLADCAAYTTFAAHFGPVPDQ
ncbi:MAG: disulfide bond formation protein DsbA [Cephaloticoccus sp.]|nr:disulfide bond formation protein DsbA [Cephaloticoccus sp.]MCF7759036.1 disulfide bond formation protein DsbA [Cephaloticoccus sp.]